MKPTFRLAAAAIGMQLFVSAANATPLLFTLTGTDSASFTLDSNATPSYVQTTPYPGAIYNSLGGLFEGITATFDLAVFNATGGGGFQLTLSGTTTYISPYDAAASVIFSGTVEHPIFSPGTFFFDLDFGRGAVADTLVISDPSAPPGGGALPVPEPADFAIMLTGIGLIGSTMRRRAVLPRKVAAK